MILLLFFAIRIIIWNAHNWQQFHNFKLVDFCRIQEQTKPVILNTFEEKIGNCTFFTDLLEISSSEWNTNAALTAEGLSGKMSNIGTK